MAIQTTVPTDPGPGRSRKRPVVVGLLTAVAVAAWCVWHVSGSDDRRRAEALRAAHDRRFTEAEPVLKDLLDRRPDDVELLDALGRGYLADGRLADAEGPLSRLVALRPGSAKYRRLRADLYLEREEWDKACADLDRLAELEPADRHPRRAALGQAFSAGRFPRAEALCRACLRDQPGDRQLLLMLAEIRWNRGDGVEAGRILDDLIREGRADYAALMARGILYDETGHPERAVPLLREVYAHDSGRKRAAGYRLGQALGHSGRAGEAEQVLAEVRRLLDAETYADAAGNQPNNLEMRVRLAEAILRDGHPPDGVELLEVILRQAPGYAQAHRVLAAYYARVGRADLAASHRQLAEGPP